MNTGHTPETIRAFERQIADDFNAGRIRAPVHLAGGNEKQLIDFFEHVREEDWVLTQWRSHYHCLLKGVPPDQLRADILAGRSITLCYPEYRILSSAIVGGILPIGVGIASSIKRHGGGKTVWCFVGDMTAEAGTFHECAKYATNAHLPVEFIIEDNGKSVCTDTLAAWGTRPFNGLRILHYDYQLPWPHAGAGTRVQF